MCSMCGLMQEYFKTHERDPLIISNLGNIIFSFRIAYETQVLLSHRQRGYSSFRIGALCEFLQEIFRCTPDVSRVAFMTIAPKLLSFAEFYNFLINTICNLFCKLISMNYLVLCYHFDNETFKYMLESKKK